MSQFKKKDKNDPDPQDIPKELVQWAKEIAFIRGPMELYLNGVLTYRECLQIALLAMTREYRQVMSRIVKKKPKQRVDHSDLLPAIPAPQNPLALPPKREKTKKEKDAPTIEV